MSDDIVKRLRAAGGFFDEAALKVVSLSECADLIERQREALRMAREALAPFKQFSDAWNASPLRGVDDKLYSLHGTTHFNLSDCRTASAALAAIDAVLKEDEE